MSLDPGLFIIPAIREPDFGAEYDLDIADILMPDTNGTEIVLALRMAHPGCKIIASSGGRAIQSIRPAAHRRAPECRDDRPADK
jgi:response regulator of citrate/malate metabolism